MSVLKFLEKRNDDNSLLRFKVPELNYFISENLFKSITDYNSYKILEKNFSSSYISMFFKKKFYQDTTNLASKILINRWNFKHDKKNFLEKILLEKKPYHHILENLFKSEPFSLSKKKKINIYSFIQSRKWFLYFYLIKFISFFTKKSENFQNKKKINRIGVNYVEGHYSEYRNDLFWMSTNIDKNSIIYYCENKNRLKKFSVNSKEIEKLELSNINFIKIWKWYNFNKLDFIEKMRDEINFLEPKDNLEKWLIKEINILLIQINYWYCFFKEQNIKIHLNSDEYSLSNVIRQIALNKLGGCSIGKCRSSPRKIEGDWFAYYPNDIFFVWGQDNIEGLIKSKNYFKNMIVSGYPYQDRSNKYDEILSIKKNFKNRGVKFSLLVIDGSHGKNDDDSHQLVPSSIMSTYLNSFLEWVLDDGEIGLIIKSKKPGLLRALTGIQKNLKRAKKTGRCIIVDKFGLEPKKLSSIVDFSVGTSVDIPSSVIQIAIKGQKAIIYDFSNLRTLEKNLYLWGEDKTIFSDLEKLIEKLKEFKLGNITNNLGDWSKKISNYDSFCDEKGSERIGGFISDLKFYFDKGHTLNETVLYANSNYVKKWGKDKIKNI